MLTLNPHTLPRLTSAAGGARLQLATAAALLGVAATALSACDTSRAGTAQSVPPLVRTIIVAPSAAGTLEYTGTVHARIESDLGFRVGGKIEARLVDPGVFVHRGQPLMRLDASNLALASSAAHQRLLAAQADAARSAADEQRLRGLIADGAVSAAAYDGALAAAKSAAANVEAATAGAHDAVLSLDYATLVADADGVVLDVVAQPGQVVAPGVPVVRLARAGAREAVVSIPETAIQVVPREAAATIYGSHGTIQAHLREVSGSADPVSRTFSVRYTLDISEKSAPLGATITVHLATAQPRAIAVPLAALHDAGRGPGVWIVGQDDRVTFRPVTVQAVGEETIEIGAGDVHPGERVVALGAQLLREGEPVRILASRS